MSTTKIEWTDLTWNPVTGCSKLSMGCKNCYAEKQAARNKAMGSAKYANSFDVTCHAFELDRYKEWKSPRMVFVCSMADLFHEYVPDEFIKQVFAVMNQADEHTFQVLTKRPERLLELAGELNFSDNIWVGVTVENADYVERIDLLRRVPAKLRYLSCEPLLGSLETVDLDGIGWVIVGGERGPGARHMDEQWARELRDLCIADGVPFFYKQRDRRTKNLALLDGVEWKQMPPRSA